MAKLYLKKNNNKIPLFPKKETIDFILNYSKSLRIQTIGELKFTTILN
jgi:hypothetical protein